MSDTDDYKAQLQAKVDELQAEQEKQTELRDHSNNPQLDHPKEQFIDDNIGAHEPKSEQDMKWEAWTDLENERAVDMDARVAQASDQTFDARDEDKEQQRDDDKQKEIQRDKDIEDTKIRQNEAELERKRYSREEAEAEQSHAQNQAIIKERAEQERIQAESRLQERQQQEAEQKAEQQREADEQVEQANADKEQQRAAAADEVQQQETEQDNYRDQFRLAAEGQRIDMDRDIE